MLEKLCSYIAASYVRSAISVVAVMYVPTTVSKLEVVCAWNVWHIIAFICVPVWYS